MIDHREAKFREKKQTRSCYHANLSVHGPDGIDGLPEEKRAGVSRPDVAGEQHSVVPLRRPRGTGLRRPEGLEGRALMATWR
jgi:hypothetical protein